MKEEKLGCFGQTWNLVAVVILIMSIIFAVAIFANSESSFEVRVINFFIAVTSAAYLVYQIYKRKPDGFLSAIRHEFFITRKSISGSAIWIVNRIREILEEVTKQQTTELLQGQGELVSKMDKSTLDIKEHVGVVEESTDAIRSDLNIIRAKTDEILAAVKIKAEGWDDIQRQLADDIITLAVKLGDRFTYTTEVEHLSQLDAMMEQYWDLRDRSIAILDVPLDDITDEYRGIYSELKVAIINLSRVEKKEKHAPLERVEQWRDTAFRLGERHMALVRKADELTIEVKRRLKR